MRLSIFKFFFVFFVAFSLEAQMISRTQVMMGTFITISLEEKNKHAINDAFDIFKNIDASISSYKATSPIYKLNATKQASLNAITHEALVLSQRYYQETEGYFDISIGSITKDLYNFGEKEMVPSKKQLRDATINFDALVFDTRYASLKQGVKIDLGGMGKGFGVDKVSNAFKDKNITKARIVASGDIRCLGECTIAIQNPFAQEALASFTTKGKEIAISTSGNYNRYVESVKNNHLLDPKRKRPQDRFVSMTLIATLPNADLDAYATAASVMPKAFAFLESLDVAYIILKSDGDLLVSENIEKFTQNLKLYYIAKQQVRDIQH